MNKFDFYQDVKCSIWLRQFFTIEAENEKEAKMKAKEFQDKDVSKSNAFTYSEFQFETEELMMPDENDNHSTMHLYVPGEEYPFATNTYDGTDDIGCCIEPYKDAHQVAFREMTGYIIECSYDEGGNLFQAFHKNDKLVVMVLMPEKKAKVYTFCESWDSLVNENQTFRKRMTEFLKRKYWNNPNIKDEIHDWLTGHLTEMKPSSEAVDDAVPFTLLDLISCATPFASVRELQPAELIGYRVVGDDDELPADLFSFQIIREREEAIRILQKTEVEEPHKTGMKIWPVYEGEIEEPTFI